MTKTAQPRQTLQSSTPLDGTTAHSLDPITAADSGYVEDLTKTGEQTSTPLDGTTAHSLDPIAAADSGYVEDLTKTGEQTTGQGRQKDSKQPKLTSQFPTHFARDTAPHSLDLINFAADEFNKTSLDSGCEEALIKLGKQTEGQGIQADTAINNFLNRRFQDIEKYQALSMEYAKLQKLEGKPRITAYIKAAERSIKAIHEKFDLFLAEQKLQFNEAYKVACPDQGDRDALWKKYEKNLKTKMMVPVDEFGQEISHNTLLSQSMAHYLNLRSDNPTATYQNGKKEEKFTPLSVFIDSEGMPLNVQYDKKTGKVSEIRANPLTPTLTGFNAKSGDVGDAFAIIVASHGKDLAIKVVVPTSQSDYLLTEMDPGLIQVLVIGIAWAIQKWGEKRIYKNRVAKAATEKGISLDNISVVSSKGGPLVFSDEMKKSVAAKIEEWEDNFAKFEMKEEEKFNQPQQPPLVPCMA
jgi:hypothetical protein